MPPEDSFDALHSAVQVFARPRPVPYRNDRAPRPLPRTMRPPEARANDPRLAQSERDIARRELSRGDTLGRLADMGAAQSAPDPIHTPLESNVIAGSRMVLPGAYDAGNAAGRIALGENAWGDLALNTGMAALPFLGVRGLRGEPAPAPMRAPAPSSEMGPMVNDLDQWIQGGMPNTRREMLPELIRRQRSIDGSYGGVPPDNTVSMNDLIDIGRDPERAPFLPEALNDHLGEFGALGERGAMPLLGSPDIAADPLANPTRPGLPRNAQPPWMRAPNEDRYLFGRQPYTRTNAEDGFATYDFRANNRPYRVRMSAEDPENPSQVTVDFGPLGADETLSATPTGDMRPADALRTMRTVTGILRDDAQNFQRGGYHWAGSPEHTGLYDTMLSRYGAPEGYQVQRDAYGGASLQRALPAEAPRPVAPDARGVRRSLADRVLSAPPAPIERSGDMLRLGDDRGVLQARVQPTNSVIKVDALGLANGVRGTMGARILRALLDEANSTGRVIVSDTRLSADAVNAVESLRRLGLTVTKTPDFHVAATGSHVSGNGPLYVITRGPAPEWSRVMDAYYEPNVSPRARAAGVSAVRSGSSVSSDASNVYQALSRRGYAVEPLAGGRFRIDTSPVAPDAGSAGLDTSRVAYRGLGRPYDPANGGYYQAFTSSEADAREYGSHVMAAHLRPGRNLAVDGGGNNFNALSVEQLPADVRARLHPGAGSAVTTDQIAHAAREAGYDSVTVRNVHDNRWGERPAAGSSPRTIDFVFNTRNISPLDHVPSQPIEGGAAPGKVRLSDSDRALLAELESPVAPDGGGAEDLAHLREQGFNVDQPLYHGSNRDLSGGFQASDDAELNGVWLAPDPNDASFYAGINGDEGANVTPVFTRGRIVDFNSPEIADWRRRLDDWRFGARPEGTTWPEPPPGVAGVRGNNLGRAYWEPPIEGGSEEVVVFDPANITSRFARTPPATGGAPPPTDPKSLPRRKPPSGGFTVFGAPR